MSKQEETKRRGRPKGPEKVAVPLRISPVLHAWLETKANRYDEKVNEYLTRNLESQHEKELEVIRKAKTGAYDIHETP